MEKTIDNWSDVVELTITGSIDSCDMNCFSKMQNIEKLNLKQTGIVKIHGCADLKKLCIVTLPTTVKEVADSAFAGCSSLHDINLDSVYKIGDNSFSYCREIKNIQSSKLKTIGSSSFWGCNKLETFAAPHVITIGKSAFCYCDMLRQFDFSSVKYLDYDSFAECYNLEEAIIPNLESLVNEKNTLGRTFIRCRSLKNIYLGEKIEEIPSYTFYGCRGLTTVKIPLSVRSIGEWAFGDCQMSSLEIPEGIEKLNKPIYSGYGLETLTLPSSLKTLKIQEGMDGTIFGSSHRLKDFTCKSTIPLSETGLDNSGLGNATLHVPAFAINNYKNSEVWNSFGSIEPLDEEFMRIEIGSDFDLSCTDGISENAELILTNDTTRQWCSEDPAGHLTFSADQSLKINRFTQFQNWAINIDTNEPYSTTLIANNVITADSIEV
ncbi:MAG: leucine-rich repeat domain-containing protein [Muribaculaceae bacterium]|nr:leucine-rich repeat domain-containing protein [Muribaculaceae bacterium]